MATYFCHEHIMKDTPPSRIADLLGDTLRIVMETYAHFIEERQAQLDKASAKTEQQGTTGIPNQRFDGPKT